MSSEARVELNDADIGLRNFVHDQAAVSEALERVADRCVQVTRPKSTSGQLPRRSKQDYFSGGVVVKMSIRRFESNRLTNGVLHLTSEPCSSSGTCP
jgi:hypothetical protein